MQHAIIFFDGLCNLCNASVQFVIKRDPKDYFRFSALQDEASEQYLGAFNIPVAGSDSILLLENGQLYSHSTAALRISRRLSGLWPLLYAFIVIPVPLRDFFYKLISRYRYRIWGRRESCILPSPDLKAKFL